jgi:hypothetical protein
LGTIGLHDLTFFSVQGTGSGPVAVTAARAKADRILQEYFASFCTRSVSGVLPPPAAAALPQISVDADASVLIDKLRSYARINVPKWL